LWQWRPQHASLLVTLVLIPLGLMTVNILVALGCFLVIDPTGGGLHMVEGKRRTLQWQRKGCGDRLPGQLGASEPDRSKGQDLMLACIYLDGKRRFANLSICRFRATVDSVVLERRRQQACRRL
jgi:hypothetical protein